MKTITFYFLFLLVFQSCEIATVNYAVEEIQLQDKSPITIAGRPGVKMNIRNKSTETVYDIKVTIKAKKNQDDISVVLIKLDELLPSKQIEKTAIFSNLSSHNDYEFLTYAVDFSRSSYDAEDLN